MKKHYRQLKLRLLFKKNQVKDIFVNIFSDDYHILNKSLKKYCFIKATAEQFLAEQGSNLGIKI